ncbi:MAG: hypothetical protein JWO32_911 [Bacteroidetes bacterium]|nr:hypothetical protein [Bacteroidota bacterium]
MKTLLPLIFIILCLTSLAQQSLSEDQFIKDSLRIRRIRLITPQFKLDNREAFLEGQALTINGFDAGVLLKEKLRFTLGYYSMKGSLKAFKKTVDSIEYGRLIQLNYGSINSEIMYIDTRFISLGMPLEIACGNNTFQNKNITENTVTSSETGMLIFANFGVSATFKPMRFMGLKGMAGYRKTIYNQVKDFNFDGFFTSIGLNFDFHELLSDIKMFRLKKKYHHGNSISNIVDILTN